MRAIGLTAFLFFAAALCFVSCRHVDADSGENQDTSTLEAPDKTALMVIAPDKFNDDELFVTRGILETAKIQVTLASTTTDEATGMHGGKATPDIAIAAADGVAYDAVVFVGGSGTTVLLEDVTAQNLAITAYNSGKLVAAICMAPEILANAGLLNGIRATCWSGGVDNLKSKGAVFVDENVVVDGRIITGNGPGAAAEFGNAIVEYLAGL
jgi:protease I